MPLKRSTCALALVGLLGASPVFAQNASLAESSLAAAETAIGAEDWQSALELLERAYLADPNPYYLFRRILVLEKMGESALALAVLQENRQELAASDRVTGLALLEERLRDPVETAEPAPGSTERGGWSGPSIPLLATGGALAVGGAVLWGVSAAQARSLRCSLYARMDESCRARSARVASPEDEFNAAGARIRTLYVVGVVTTIAGVGLTAATLALGRPRSGRNMTLSFSVTGTVGLSLSFQWSGL